MAVSIGDVIGTIKLEDTFSPRLEIAARNLEQFAGKLDKIGSRFESVGRTLTAGLTLPLVAFVGTSVKAAATFESSFAGVRKTVDATEAQFASLSKQIRELAAGPNAVPIDVNQLNKVAEAAGQLGIARQNIVDFTRVMADLGETTNLTADEAATSVAQFQNIFGAAGKEVDRFGSTLVALGNAGASTEKQIIEMGLRIAGAGNQIGLSQGEVLAFASALSSVGIDAEAGGSALSKIMIEIALSVSKGGKELSNFAAIAGSTAEQFASSFENDAAQAVEEFISGLGRLKESGGDVLGTLDAIGITEIRMRDALLRASGAGDLLSDSLDLQSRAWTDNTALTKEAQERYKTFESQLRITRNQINDSAITLGTALLPAIRDLINTIQPLIADIAKAAEWFSTLPEPVRATTLAIIAVVAATGPALFVIGGITQGVAGLTAAFGAILPAIGSAAAVLTGPVGWIAAGIALLAAWKPTRDFLIELSSTIFDVYVSAVKGAVDIASAWWDSFEDIRTPIVDLARLISEFAGAGLPSYLSVIESVISSLSAWARETAETIKFTFYFARAIREDLFAAISSVIGAVKTVIGWYVQYVSWVDRLTSQIADSIVVFLNWSGILSAVRFAVDVVVTGLSILWGWLVKAKNKLAEWIDMVGGIAPILAAFNPGLAASLALFNRWSDRAKELAKNNKDVADTQGQINKKVEEGAKIPPPKPPKPPSPPQPPVLLSEDQEKALKSINERVAAMAREMDARTALLAALKQSPEAYLAEQRAQEINNAVFEARQELLQAELELSPELKARIEQITGATFDSTIATEKYNQALEAVAGSISQLGSINIPKLDAGGDENATKQWAGSLAALRFKLDDLRSALQKLPKDSAEYRNALAVLTETEKRYQAQVSRLPEILDDRKTARTSETRSALAVAESIARSIDEEIAQLGRGSAAWDAYAKSVEVKAQAIQILGVFNLPKPDASDTAALAEWNRLFDQWKAQFADLSATISLRMDADAAAELRRSLEPARAEFERFAADVSRYVSEGLLSEKEARKILLRANELTGALRDSMLAAAEDINFALADGLVEAAFEGGKAWDALADNLESILKRLISDWLTEWFRAMAQWLSRWIATQAAARAASAAMGTGGGGGGGGGAGMYAGLFQMGAKAYSAYSGGTASASQFSSAAAGWAVAAFALYVVYKGFVEKHTAEWGAVNLKTGVRTGDTAKVKATVQARVNELRQQLDDISEMLEIDLKELGDVTLGKRDKGYYVQIGEGFKEGFATVEAAMDYARVAAIKFGVLGDQVSANVRQAIDKSVAKTMEAFQADIDLAKKIDNLKMGGEIAAQMAEIFRLRTQEIQHAQALGLSIKELIGARKQEFDSIRNSVLGIDDSIATSLKNLFSYQKGAEEAHNKLRATFERIFGTTIEEAEKFVKEFGDMLSEYTFVPGTSSIRPGKDDTGPTGGSQWLDAAGNAVDETTRTILNKVDRFKKALERYYEQLAALPEKLTEDQMRLGVFNQLFGFIENNAKLAAKYEGQRAAFAKLQVDIQFKLIKLWLEAFGVFEEFAALYNDAYAAALQTAGRPSGGRGGGGKVDRKEIREDLLDQIDDLEAELAGPLHTAFLQFSRALDEFKEKAKEGKLSAEDLARGIAALTQKFQENIRAQANTFAGIGTDFTKRLDAVADFFKELRELGRGKTGMPNWLVDVLEGKAFEALGKELNGAIAAFGGLVDPMLAVNAQADALRQNVLAYAEAAGWSAEQIAAAMAAIDRGAEYQRQQGINSTLDRLFAWAKQAGILTKEAIEHERSKALLDITIIEAQLRFYGALTGEIEGWINGIRNWINSAAFGLGNDIQDVRIVGNSTSDVIQTLVDKIKSMVEAWRAAVDQFADATSNLMTDEALTNLTQEEQLAFAKSQAEDLAAKARAGDADALAKLDAARAEYLRELRESEGTGFGFTQGFNWIMGLSADILENAQSAEESLIARELADNVAAWSHVMQQLADQLEEAFYQNNQDLIDAIYNAIGGVPGFAQGGIVMRGPRLVRVAEQVAEAIVPLDKLATAIPYNRFGMAGQTVDHTAGAQNRNRSGGGADGVSVYDQSVRFRMFQRQDDSSMRLAKIEASNQATAQAMARMQQDMNALRRRLSS